MFRMSVSEIFVRLVLCGIFLCFSLLGQAQAAPGHCEAPAELIDLSAALPRSQAALESRREIVVVALGSSSTQGAGATTHARTYPAQLQRALQLALPEHTVHVVNLGRGGERAGSMVERIDSEVAAYAPDLVIWQTGVNDLLMQADVNNVPALLNEGINKIHKLGADVVLMDVQFAPRVVADGKHQLMMSLLEDAARVNGAGFHRRFDLMEYWAHPTRIGYSALISGDGLHMTDASYRCTGRTLSEGLLAAWRRNETRIVSRP
jgi:acyl-CoA thioesterase I